MHEDDNSFLEDLGVIVGGAAAGAGLLKGADALINRGLSQELDVVQPRFLTREGAEREASLINKVFEANVHPNTRGILSPSQTQQVFTLARRLEAKPDKVVEILEEARFGISLMTAPDKVRAVHAALVSTMKKAFDVARKLPSGKSVGQSMNEAIVRMGGIDASTVKGVFPELAQRTEGLEVELLVANSLLRDMGEQLADISRQIDMNPSVRDDLLEFARPALENYFESAVQFAGAKSEIGRALNIMKYFADPRAGDIIAGIGGAALGGAALPSSVAEGQEDESRTGTKIGLGLTGAVVGAAAGITGRNVAKGLIPKMAQRAPATIPGATAGMSHRDLEKLLRLFQLSGGQPRSVVAISKAAAKKTQTGMWDKSMEVFYNAMLSGPATWGTITVSGVATIAMETASRALAGLWRMGTKGDPRLFQEAMDQAVGYVAYLGDNLRSAALSFNESRSIINPMPQVKAIAGVKGDAVRVPSRVMTTLDEFTRVSAYRAFIRSKSLRVSRDAAKAQGLAGNRAQQFIAQRLDQDLASAFDGPTGIGLVEDAMKFAEVPAFTTPLAKGTPSAAVQRLVNDIPALRLFVPFVRSVANLNRYAFLESTPLGLLSPRIRQVLKTPGEARDIMVARMGIGSSLAGLALWKVTSGEMTGGGPKDPTLRTLWEKNNQPYSIKVNIPGSGEKWVSYRRLDPFASILGVMSDFMETHESWDQLGDEAVEEVAASLVAAVAENFGSKGYATGFTTLVGVMTGDEREALKLWQGPVSAMAVPRAASAFNDDPYVRIVSSTVDRIRSRTPGFSDDLPAALDTFGELRRKSTDPLWSSWVPTPARATSASMEDKLLDLGRGFTAPKRMHRTATGRTLDLTSRAWSHREEKDISPYERWGQIMREKGLRKQVETYVNSAEWEQYDDGLDAIRGGPRWEAVNTIIQSVRQEAWLTMLEEFPDLREAIEASRELGVMDRSGTVSSRADTLMDMLRPRKRRKLAS
jgi:hypothetical protein